MLRDTIRQDIAANPGDRRSQYVMVMFRVCTALLERGGLARTLSKPLRTIYHATTCWILGIELPLAVKAGPGLRLLHGTGIVVHGDTTLGAWCTLKHGCTLGVKTGEGEGHRPPVLGDRVNLGPGAQILGPVHVGDGALIGAGAIVLKDVPPGGVAVGNPARVVRVDDPLLRLNGMPGL
ncbi:MAG: hypothetical protein J7513_00520 [Solirubrobacteraceae bacterium]|nr:hypothetical protein [Solirubrobacteraceae bacterium]